MKTYFRKYFLYLAMIIAMSLSGKADIVQVGTGTSTTPYWNHMNWTNTVSHYLFTKAELNAAGFTSAGVINKIAINVQSYGGDATYQGYSFNATHTFSIHLQTTANTILTSAVPAPTNWTQVYSALFNLNAADVGTWKWYTLATPFYWDGNSSLLLKTCSINSTGAANYGPTSYFYASSVTSQALYYISDAITACTQVPTTSVTLRPNMKFDVDMNPTLVSVNPPTGTIYKVGLPVAANLQPAVTIKRTATQPAVSVSYQIAGPTNKPVNQQTVIYTAKDVNGQFTEIPLTLAGDPFTYNFQNATGVAAEQVAGLPTGKLDLMTADLSGGTYVVSGTYKVSGKPELTKNFNYEVVLALQNDITFNGASSPASMDVMQYPYGASSIPVELFVKNIGLNKVGKIKSNIQIYYENETTPVYTDTYTWVVDLNPLTPIANQVDSLATGASALMKFKPYTPTRIGKYKIVADCQMQDPGKVENDLTNNAFPSGSTAYQFEVINLYDVAASGFVAPSATGIYYVNYPIMPKAEFINYGASDEVNLNANIKIYDANNNLVWERNQTVPSIVKVKGIVYKNLFEFSDAFVPTTPGVYRAEIFINEPSDQVPSNNNTTVTFVVSPGMSGTYTIGANNANFVNIDNAVRALYQKGVVGPVTFELIDNSYTVGNIDNLLPALDFRTMIPGVNSVNTITFKPANNQYSVVKGGITITLRSGAGIGCIFGQSTLQYYPESPINNVFSIPMKKAYSGSEGFITFDGGLQKAFKFVVDAPATQNFRAAFYMGEGSKNITVKNCLISGNNANPSLASSLPLVKLNGYNFNYDKDVRVGGTYSSGVVVRSIAPLDVKSNMNYYGLDTLYTHDVVISNNEITGFGYGIVSIGMGPLMKAGEGYFAYYNKNNTYSGNTIYGVGRAGLFLGYEENSKIEKNRIYGISGANTELAGILAGGEALTGYLGYNNTNLYISANEISGINSTKDVYGVKVEQYPLVLPGAVAVLFPNVPESNQVINNAIYDINSNSATANKFGIRMFTSRANMYTSLVKPNYFTSYDKVINNTVYLPANSVDNDDAIIAGIAIQNANGALITNNLVTVMDNFLTQKTNAVCALLLQGSKTNFNSNRNALYVNSNNNANAELRNAIIRFVETDGNSAMINFGYNAQFEALDQWQNYTGLDMSSLNYNGMNDMMFLGANPPSLKVKTPIPFNSKLNNRGERIETVTTDLSGNTRGVANQRYDIGAIEFTGGMYTNDLEVVKVTAPANYIYKYAPVTTPGAPMVSTIFNDAEYIMTKAPVEVSARIRNNGSLAQVNKDVTVTIKREDNTGAFTVPVLTTKVPVTLSSTEEAVVNFNLADGAGEEFRPMTYSQLVSSNYTVPAYFSSMRSNVTPRHLITVSVGTDEALSNNENQYAKIVRFYIKGSKLNLIVSAENSHMDSNFVTNVYNLSTNADTLNKVAGKLNADTLLRNFGDLGLKLNYSENSQDIDLLERLGWEPHSINYSLYRSLVWSDGNDNMMTELERKDILSFLANGTAQDKKNFVIASQELPRVNTDAASISFLNNKLHITNYGTRGTLSSDLITGVTVNKNVTTQILATGSPADVKPNTAVVKTVDNGIGLANIGYYYTNMTGNINDRIMAVASSDVTSNVLYYGADWRHFKDVETILRGMFDYADNNGARIFPIELLDFTAEKINDKAIAINWTTASEVNASRFDVERSIVKATGISEFAKIAEVTAKGSSSKATYYGPVVDANVYAGGTFTYRLKMIDVDGSFKYSDEKTVALEGDNSIVTMEAITPNPVVNSANVRFQLSSDANVNVSVYNLEGQLVANLLDGSYSAGSHQVSLNASELASGQYTVVLKSGSISIVKTINVVR